MEVNGDGQIGIGDLTRIVDHVYVGGPLDCRVAQSIEPYALGYYQLNGTTFVVLDGDRPIRGMQLLLVGEGSGNPLSPPSPEIELVGFQVGDSLRVLMADLNGNAPISGVNGFSVAGQYTVTEARIADLENQSGDVVITPVGPPVAVFISAFNAEPTYSGISLQWEIQSDEQIRGFRLYRQNDPEDMSSAIASESELSGEDRSYVDSEVEGGHKYEYTLGVLMADGTEVQSFGVQIVAKKFELSLFQNHPNPFNPSTTISFTLPAKTKTKLSIYNIEGRLVTTLVDGTLDEGFKEVAWDGKDGRGNQVSTGVYFYRLTAGDRTLTKKMVLLK
jgi:hypothetical protein